jgi:hypothetical protein
MTVRERDYVVVESARDEVVSSALHLYLQFGNRHLANLVTGQIDFAQQGICIPRDAQEHVTTPEQFKSERVALRANIVVPDGVGVAVSK